MGTAVRKLCGQSSCTPVSGHPRRFSQWARAEGGRSRPDPQPPRPPPPRRRGVADWPRHPRGGSRALGPVGAREPRAVGAVWGGVELQPPPSGPAPGFGWGPEVLFMLLSSSCNPLLSTSVLSCRGGSEGGMGRRRTAASQETLGDLPGRGREMAGPGDDKLGRTGRDYSADRKEIRRVGAVG